MGSKPVQDETSVAGMTEFLGTLPEDEVHGLLKTTTGGLISAQTVKEAISIIIRYSDAITLLNRKRVKKDYLIKYLHSKKIKFALSLDKTKLCRLVLDHWGEQNVKKLKFIEVIKEKKPAADTKSSHNETKSKISEKAHFFSQSSSKISENAHVSSQDQTKPNISEKAHCSSQSTTKISEKAHVSSQDQTKPKISEKAHCSSQSTSKISEKFEQENKKTENVPTDSKIPKIVPDQKPETKEPLRNVQITELPPDSSPQTDNMQVALISNDSLVSEPEDEVMDYEQAVSLRKVEIQVGQQLAHEFSGWFYERLNSLKDFGANHFWPLCNLRAEWITSNAEENGRVDEIDSGQKCYEYLSKIKSEKKLYFNANLIPGVGVRGKINPHGFGQVMACGSLHQMGEFYGVFEQVFGLVRDPGANNFFKIKFCVLRLREGDEMMSSALCDSSLGGVVEEVDDDDDD